MITCLPSPNVAIDATFNGMSQSPSFCIDPDGKSANFANQASQLTASDVFSRSKNFIKRPSTMMASDAMNQVAQVLESTARLPLTPATSSASVPGALIRRSRRQAIVPPKLATDAHSSDSDSHELQVGQLVDVGDQPAEPGGQQRARQAAADDAELAIMSANRRKRSGADSAHEHGGANGTSGQKRPAARAHLPRSGSQIELASQLAEPAREPAAPGASAARSESQATNAESIVSSGSSTTLSALGRLSASGALSPSAPANATSSSLNVPLVAGSSRRRSSIAVIPQMQICPGDLLVYSKQLIDRMNQSDENEPPQFLTIDDKKGKNIWSSFKLVSVQVSYKVVARSRPHR